MRKLQIIGLALFSMLALGSITASSASAAEPSWLVEGVQICAGCELAAEIEGTLKLLQYESRTSTVILTEIECSGIFDGFIVDLNLALITDLLNLVMEEIGNLEGDVNTLALECLVILDGGALTDCKENTTALVWPDALSLELSLDWTITYEENAGGLKLGVFPAVAGYHVECEILEGFVVTNLCNAKTGLTSVMWSNEELIIPHAVLSEFEPLALMSERGECEVGGAEVAEVGGDGNTYAIGAELEHLQTELN